eukprot:TRINITY_DN9726_c0_g1_i1.p1 TRINITY_DN9726_c0_g1~~TRINITY_DN9726_c0_g1_i1.p1  ORF type:complete len:363 (+),score=61.80 TRINITY_DN9726_c0_g1_i1:187-1275(+)
MSSPLSESAFASDSWYSIIFAPFFEHIVVILISCSCCFILQLVYHVASWLLFGGFYKNLSYRDQIDWNVRLVAITHSLLSWWVIPGYIWPSAAIADNIYGYDPVSAFFFSVSTGYFLWDVLISIKFRWGWAFIMHAVACFYIFYFTLFPFCQRDARFFLGVFELSTPFLHVRGLQETAKWTSSRLYMINGIMFAITFTLARIVCGFYVSYTWWGDMITLLYYRNSGGTRVHSVSIVIGYLICNGVLMSLMAYWFFQILKAVVLGRSKRLRRPIQRGEATKSMVGRGAAGAGAGAGVGNGSRARTKRHANWREGVSARSKAVQLESTSTTAPSSSTSSTTQPSPSPSPSTLPLSSSSSSASSA